MLAVPCGPDSCGRYFTDNFIHIYYYTDETPLEIDSIGDRTYMFHRLDMSRIGAIRDRLGHESFYVCNGYGELSPSVYDWLISIVNTFPIQIGHYYMIPMMLGPVYNSDYINNNLTAVMEMMETVLCCKLYRVSELCVTCVKISN